MSVLSSEYLMLAAVSSIIIWLFSRKNRVITVAVANILFLICLRGHVLDWLYVLLLTAYVTFAVRFVRKRRKHKNILLIVNAVPVAGLCIFKYGSVLSDNILMPLGLSFYTFKAISYICDVYYKKSRPQSALLIFDYLCFFPVFTAGPINRAEPFFKELASPMVFDYRDQKNGCVLAGIGFFEKLVIADELSRLAGLLLDNGLSGWYSVLGTILYAFQIYTDFDAYSNIAIGTARMMGFHLSRNFNVPYMSTSLKEFWGRWHISLSEWLRDYIYFPLGGSRQGTRRKYMNILIVFLVSGFWHGSTAMFLLWGLLHGLLRIAEDFISSFFKDQKWPGRLKPLWIIVNFILVSLLWIYFRSPSMSAAGSVFAGIRSAFGTKLSLSYEDIGITFNEFAWMFILLAAVIVFDQFRYRTNMIEWLAECNGIVRWLIYAALAFIAIIFGVYGPGYHPEDFIYALF